MADSILKLIIEKGPKKGSIVECLPSSQIRIGRVVKGNSLVLRDGAISQNHLLIRFDSPNWVLLDLDTSNGTILNEEKVTPDEPQVLKEGDVVKIGERSLLFVRIQEADKGLACGEENPGSEFGVRRNPRRGKRDLGSNLGKSERRTGNEEESVRVEDGNAEGEESMIIRGQKLGRRSKRIHELDLEKSERKATEIEQDSVRVEDGNAAECVGESMISKAKKFGRRGAGKRVADPDLGKSVAEKNEVALEEEEVPRVESKFSTKKNPKRGGSAKRKTEPELGKSAKERSQEAGTEAAAIEEELPETQMNSEIGGGAMEIELEGMTLGGWLDRMGKWLPNLIRDVSEDLMKLMRERADQVKEFVSKQGTEQTEA